MDHTALKNIYKIKLYELYQEANNELMDDIATIVNPEANIIAAGLRIGTVSNAGHPSIPAGNVISQSPTACTACAISGDSVNLIVSLGPNLVDVPNVIGLDQTPAEATLLIANLKFITSTANDPAVPAGKVISQNPAACLACVATSMTPGVTRHPSSTLK